MTEPSGAWLGGYLYLAHAGGCSGVTRSPRRCWRVPCYSQCPDGATVSWADLLYLQVGLLYFSLVFCGVEPSGLPLPSQSLSARQFFQQA